MLNYFISFLIVFILLIFVNLALIKTKFILHNQGQSFHKKIGKSNIPVSGGIYFLLIIIYLFFSNQSNFINLIVQIITFIIFFYIGFLSDIGKEITAKKRLYLQSLILLIIFSILDINILETNIDLLDSLIENKFLSLLFTVFCILILINGLNFIDGVNGNSTGFLLSSYFILFFLDQNILNEKYFLKHYLIIIIFSLTSFYILNCLEKNFLGDSGVYILGLFLGVDIINFCNFNETISPFIAITLLWYPAFENLFSIVRKYNSKKSPLDPDKNHLHTLIYNYLLKKNFKYPNTLTGLLINLTLVPSFLSIIFFYNNTYKLCWVIFIYIMIYISTYLIINSKLKNE